MTGDNTEGINFKVITTGRPDVDGRKPCNFKPLTLRRLVEWIDAKPISFALKEELKKMASAYPEQALHKWQLAYQRHLAAAQQSLVGKDVYIVTSELGEDEPPESPKNDNKAPRFSEFD